MERNSDATRRDAAIALSTLADDRSRLAARIRVPWVLLAALGGLAALGVVSPAIANPGDDYQPPLVVGMAVLIGVIIVGYLIQRGTGIRFRTMGVAANAALCGVVATCLLLFMLSLALVSLELRWTLVLTGAAAFVVTTGLARVAYRSAAKRLRRG
ncbi:MAG TPA: hypothetical protein VN041_18720 [Microbacterium sp.]|nr:hypothetical protein [Microbacterium sp.]